METENKFRNKNGKNTCTNQGCGVFLTDSWVVYFVINLAFYLAMVIWLALWVLHLAFVCSLITRVCPAFHTQSDGKLSGGWVWGYFTLVLCFVITNSVWLTSAHVASNGATYCGSHGSGSGQETDHESNVTWFWDGASTFLLSQSHS